MLETMNIYGKYSGAYKSGGFNTRDPDEQGFSDGFDEEKLNAFEFGVKGEALDHKLRFSSAVFYQKFEDYQYNVQIPGSISGTRVFNIDNGEMSGLELEMQAMPTAGLLLQVSYAYLDTKFDDVDNPFTGETETVNFGNAPKHSYSLVAGYTFPTTPIGVVNANASYNYVDKRNPNAENTYRDAYDLINARIALSEVDGLGGQWELALMGQESRGQRLRGVCPGQPSPGQSRCYLGRWAQLRSGCLLSLLLASGSIAIHALWLNKCKPWLLFTLTLDLIEKHGQRPHPQTAFSV